MWEQLKKADAGLNQSAKSRSPFLLLHKRFCLGHFTKVYFSSAVYLINRENDWKLTIDEWLSSFPEFKTYALYNPTQKISNESHMTKRNADSSNKILCRFSD